MIRGGQVVARAGEVVDVDLDIEADRLFVEKMADRLELIPTPDGWVDRSDDEADYLDRSMRARRRSNR